MATPGGDDAVPPPPPPPAPEAAALPASAADAEPQQQEQQGQQDGGQAEQGPPDVDLSWLPAGKKVGVYVYMYMGVGVLDGWDWRRLGGVLPCFRLGGGYVVGRDRFSGCQTLVLRNLCTPKKTNHNPTAAGGRGVRRHRHGDGAQGP